MKIGNLNALKMFDAASRHLNFRLAAQELHVTQGAVAQQVRSLETQLKTPLFYRRPRGLELTHSGKEYQQQIQRALTIIDTATDKLLKKNNQVTLSVTPSFASKWLVPRLANFALLHPDIDLHTVASGKLCDFKAGGVDIAIRIAEAPYSSELQIIQLAPMNLCAVCSPEYSETLTSITNILDLLNQQLIQDAHFHWDYLFELSKGKNDAKILQFNQTSLAIDAAINGQGITLSPLILVEKDIMDGKLVNLCSSMSKNSDNAYHLLALKSVNDNQPREKVIQWLIDETNNMTSY